MVFKPATPLSVLLLSAFVLLLLSTLSAPIIESINIATFGGVKFGVFGYCPKSAGCSALTVGYNMDTILANEGKSDFKLPSKARNSLTNLLIIHPIAAFMTLVLFVLSVLAHLQGPAHSPKFLLALLIFSLPTLMLSLLAFLIDILIFLPHLQWGGWIVLAATILIFVSSIVMCGMRRQIVGRIARSKRIQENAEMNGQSYFVRSIPAPSESADKIPEYANFETGPPGNAQQEGERIPLNPRLGSPPIQDDAFARSNTLRTEGSDRSNRSNYAPQSRGNGPLGPGTNPMGGNAAMGPPARSQYSNQSLQHSSSGSNSGSSVGYGQQKMRNPGYQQGYGGPLGAFDVSQGREQGRYGGPPPMGAGGYRGGPGQGGDPRRGPFPGYGPNGPMRGPSSGNNGYGGPPPGNNGYGGPPPGNNGYGGPPPGNNGYGGYGPPPRGASMGLRAPPPRRQMPPSDPGYDGDYPAGIDFPAGIDNPSDERKEFEKTLAPVGADLIGRAVTNDSRDKLGLQDQENTGGPSGKLVMVNPDQPAFEDSYIPPRPQWQPETTPSGYQTPPAELPAPTDPSNIELTKSKTNRISGSYYEDVAPQFDNSHETDPPTTPQPILPIPGPGAQIGQFNPAPAPATGGPWNPPPIPQLEEGQLSPTISTTSGFTSISQRGINPSWQEEQKRVGGPRPVGRTNVGLAGNPDFELPPGRGGRGVRGGRGGRGGLR